MKKKKRMSPKIVALILTAVILTIAIIGATVFCVSIVTNDKIYPNVHIAGFNVGGLTKDEAVDLLNESIASTYGANTLTVEYPDRTIEFTPEIVNATLDAAAAVDSAYEFGRYGNLISRVSSYLKADHSNIAFTVNTGLTFDEAAIAAIIADHAEDAHIDVVPSKVEVFEEENYLEVQIGSIGVDMDQELLLSVVMSALQNCNLNPITMEYSTTSYTTLDLSNIYQELCTSAADAYYDSETHEIVEEQRGYSFDLSAANQQIAMAADGDVIRVDLEVIEPEVTKEYLESIYFSDTLSSFSTGNLGGANRVNNITLAAQAINGTVLGPGEVFSYNDVVGQRTAERGYKEAGAYANGQSVQELGGGICQVSSTLYNSVLYANLEIVYRTNHMFTVSYVDLGMDATVSWGSPDFKFKNNTEYPIRIDAKVENYKVVISIIGTKTDNIEVKMSHEVLATIPYTTKTTSDPDKVNSTGRTGYNVVTYRHLIDSTTGEEISKTVEAYSNYSKTDIIVYKKVVEQEVTDRYEEQTKPKPEKPEEPEEPETPEEPEEPEVPEEPTEPEEPVEPDTPDTPPTDEEGSTDSGTPEGEAPPPAVEGTGDAVSGE